MSLSLLFSRRALASTRRRPSILTSRAMSIFGDNCPLVVSPRQLRDMQVSDPTAVAVLDASWHMPNSPRNARSEFLADHIPGAHYLDLDRVAKESKLGLKHMMPDEALFARSCELFGITPSSHVVIYDKHGVFSSPRALFMFRAFGHHRSSILNGGLPAWLAHGGSTVKGHTDVKTPTDYPVPKLDSGVVREYEQMVANAAVNPSSDAIAEIVVDARSTGRYLGTDPEPRPGLPSGHIPHSYSLPFTSFLRTQTYTPPWQNPDGPPTEPVTYTSLRSNQELLDVLQETLGPVATIEVLSGRRSIVTTCGSGMTAGVLWLGLKSLGVERISLYDESWTGYAARKDSPIVTGEESREP